jgi:hypothetical protein
MSAVIGPALGSAACEAENAFRALARMSLWLDSAGLEVTEEVAAVIADVADIATGMTALADQIGRAEVERRSDLRHVHRGHDHRSHCPGVGNQAFAGRPA